MKKLFLYVFLVLMFCSNAFAKTSVAWKTDNKYLTPKCFIYELVSSDRFEEYYDRYAPENKKWEDWWNNIGLYFGKEIPLEDSFEASWGKTLSLTRYLKDCTSPKPITEDEEELLSYEVSGTMPKGSCKILAPNVNAKCLDIKIINVLASFPRSTSVMHSNIYGIFELANKNKIILPLKMYYVVEKKTETITSEAQAEISLLNFEWIKNQKFSNTNQLVGEDKFMQLLEYNIPSVSLYLGMSKHNKKIPLLNHFRMVLGGPPNKIKYFDDSRYIVASACRAHSCGEKGLVWIDTKEKLLIGLILHYFFEKEKNLDDGYFLIFSKNYQTFDKLPEQFFISLKEWIKEEKISPEKIRFIGTDDSIKEFPNTLK